MQQKKLPKKLSITVLSYGSHCRHILDTHAGWK